MFGPAEAGQSAIAVMGMGLLRDFLFGAEWFRAHSYVIDYINFTVSTLSVK